ncbi:MAG TPA: SIMPL domain-containing protein [Candidatus Paceibacterota bacterium]
MNDQDMDRFLIAMEWPRKLLIAVLGALALFLLFAAFGEIKSLRFIGSGVPATNTITVTGEGEVFAAPDIAEFNATVMEEGADVKAAQEKATEKINDIYAYLQDAGIEEKDIRTIDYSANPRYEWQRAACPAGSLCPDGRQVLIGYEASQTLSIKVRDTKKAGDLLAGVGGKGVSSVSGLNFTVDDQDAVEAEARDLAIADAKAKAKRLAKSLNVSLVRIVGFDESGNLPPYYAKAAYGLGGTMDAVEQAIPAPEIPTGENKIISNISLTYEIQ